MRKLDLHIYSRMFLQSSIGACYFTDELIALPYALTTGTKSNIFYPELFVGKLWIKIIHFLKKFIC